MDKRNAAALLRQSLKKDKEDTEEIKSYYKLLKRIRVR
jgi:hypothetical protein